MATLPDVIAISSTTRIADWTASHGLTPDEVVRLESVLIDYPPNEVAGELDEELRWIFGARKLARMPKLTREDFLAGRRAVESGLTPLKPQDAD